MASISDSDSEFRSPEELEVEDFVEDDESEDQEEFEKATDLKRRQARGIIIRTDEEGVQKAVQPKKRKARGRIGKGKQKIGENGDDEKVVDSEVDGKAKAVGRKKGNKAINISFRGSASKIHKLFKEMSLESRERFSKCCFGHLLDMPPFTVNRSLMCAVLRRYAKWDMFDFDGYDVRCFLKDIALITGLSVTQLVNPIRYDEGEAAGKLQKRYLRTGAVDEYKLLKVIKKLENNQEEEEEDLLRMHMLYFLSVFLLPNSQKNVDPKWIQLAEDLSRFNGHFWGFEVHRLLVDSFRHMSSKLGTPQFNAYGCLHVFTVLCYMHFPSLAPPSVDHVYPRLLAYKLKGRDQDKGGVDNTTLKTYETNVDKCLKKRAFIVQVEVPLEEQQAYKHRLPTLEEDPVRGSDAQRHSAAIGSAGSEANKFVNGLTKEILEDIIEERLGGPIRQLNRHGGEGDCFYIVGSGEFEVLATQEEKNEEVPRVLQSYTAEKLSSFGELALMYNKPLQASVHAVTSGTLWALKREDFRGILMSEFSNFSSLKLLRSVEIFSKLTILQLSHIAESLSEVSFSDGQTIINKNEFLSALYIIKKGRVKITYGMDLMRSANVDSLLSDNTKRGDYIPRDKELWVEKTEGSYFGEWVLLGENIDSLTAMAVGDVVCVVVRKEKFDSAIGPLAKLSQNDRKPKDYSPSSKQSAKNIDVSSLAKVQISNLEWITCVYSTDCGEIGLVRLRGSGSDSLSENMLSLKRFSKKSIGNLGKEAQVLKEKDLMKSLSSINCIPQVLCTCADPTHVGILLNSCLACPMASILHSPLDEPSARFCAASVVLALEELHKSAVLYRGVSLDVLMFDQTGHLQVVDFRFGKTLSSERTFTICGMTDSLAPEIVQGKGHGLAADWWALGVLIYFMLQAEMPFGSWRQSEVDTFAKIAKGHFTLPQSCSPEAVDIITKLLQVDENARLGSQGPDSVKSHRWFDGVDWKGIADCSFPVPNEIVSRIALYMDHHTEDCSIPQFSPSRDVEEPSTSKLFEDW